MSARASILKIEFEPMTWAAFKREYAGGVVGPIVVWERICKPKVGLTLSLDGRPELSMPWYSGGDWRDGRPRMAPRGRAPALIRIPAVRVDGRLLALDGCHRLTELRPRMVVVDWFEPTKHDRRYLNDLFNYAWRPR